MNSIDFGKKCKTYNSIYKELFGYIPCKEDYLCTQNEFFNALVKAINTKKEIDIYLSKKAKDICDNKKY